MKRLLVSLTLMGAVGMMLGACAYDPYYDGPYDRDYGPPRGAYGPPPPPPNYNAPPAGYDQAQQGYAPRPLTRGQIARMNDPDWCNAHQQRCAYFHSMADGQQPPQGYGPPPGYNGQDQGPPPQGYGPPPGYDGRDQGPPPQGGYGPPPNYNGPPPGNDEANGPPQQMQQPQQ